MYASDLCWLYSDGVCIDGMSVGKGDGYNVIDFERSPLFAGGDIIDGDTATINQSLEKASRVTIKLFAQKNVNPLSLPQIIYSKWEGGQWFYEAAYVRWFLFYHHYVTSPSL